MAIDRKDIVACRACGTLEHVHLLDAKPELGAQGNDVDFTRLECIACYGPGYTMLDTEHVKLSVAPKLTLHYRRYAANGRDA